MLPRIFPASAHASPWAGTDLIREELFSPDRLAEHGRSLARAQPVSRRRRRNSELSARLRQNADALLRAYRAISGAVDDGATITPSAEWILDNFHVVEEQVADIRIDLPPGYYRQLPKLAEGPFAGLPRVFGIAWAYVAHTDSRFDADLLCGFVDAYQSVQPLTIGELWAIPITLRFVLIENLRRAADRIVNSHAVRVQADAYADRIVGLGDRPPEPIVSVLGDHPMPLSRTFVVQLAHRLRDPLPAVAPALQWLEHQLEAGGTTIELAVQAEHARQAAMNVTARNIITSMRAISAMDWPDIVERVSLVDRRLRMRTNFADLDFATRDNYRKRIEKLARRSPMDELEVVDAVIGLVDVATAGAQEARRSDPGYYLLGAGQPELERAVRFRPALRDWGRRLSRAIGVPGYIAVCIVGAGLVLASVIGLMAPHTAPAVLLLFTLLAVLPAVDLAATLLSRIILAVARPVALPALEFRNGVPPDAKTLVVIPTLLSGDASVDEVVTQLEIHYLANPKDDLTFAILSDWTDAPSEAMPGDEEIVLRARAAIDRLNRTHRRLEGDRFLLLHRRRVWNETQECWIGWERKRGKLAELNRLLRGAKDTTFIPVGGRPPVAPDDVRYVVTLDSDTRLPRDTVRKLIGKMAHPVNRPRIDAGRHIVVEGYGILQPRVTLALPHTSEGSWFQRVFSGARGMDPYAAPVSDAYQDLFGEGSFLGKGIYDVDAFEATMEGRTPENAILSHDLFEGIFARAGLAGDIEFVEEFPPRYDVAASRQHRWARGDWQLLRWLLEPARTTGIAAATLLGRWKMLDNLRRTLSAPITVLALIAGFALPPVACLVWTLFILLALAAPALLPVFLGAFRRPPRASWSGHLAAVGSDLRVAVGQTAFVVTTLPHQAALMTDAIVRTLYRLRVSRKRLLEWRTAEQAASSAEPTLPGYFLWMWQALLVAAISEAVGVFNGPVAALMALPFVAAWFASPAIVWAASRIRANPRMAALGPEDAQQLRLIARRTWRYFETFVTAEQNFLPPDNFQEGPPQSVVATRTSPTNIGLYLMSVMSARDFGWIGTAEAVDRLEATFDTLRRMFRFRGHYYNWYDTKDLRPLDPQYVSSVDSGNLAGHLIAIANACDEATRSGSLRDRALAGIDDALLLVRASLAPEQAGDLRAELAGVRKALDGRGTPAERLDRAESRIQALVTATAGLSAVEGENQARIWAEAASASIASHRRDQSVDIGDLNRRLAALATLARDVATQMDFRFLMDPERQLMSIGYLTTDSSRDPNCYDLLASEARLASFFAIAKGDAPTKHWFRLGRSTTAVEGSAALVSWSGSMFEYLMPSLVMAAPTGSLLELTTRLIVRRQVSYGRALGVPWGISESAYNARDLEFTYQYSNFGVPGLGLKRGLSSSTVIAPYATALAAMVDPVSAARNFEALAAAGALGHFGYYEALDYTPQRIRSGETVAVVRCYMAHHQGMTVVALANVIFGGVDRRRFHAEPMIAATELLLEERHPKTTTATPVRADEAKESADVRPIVHVPPRHFATPHTASPHSALLSNTRYGLMVTNSGSGYSRWNDIAVTRWREDATLEEYGSYVYLRDPRDGRTWSASYQPTRVEAESYTADFAEDRIRIARRDRTIMTTMDVAISAEDDAEARRVSIANIGGMEREIELTSYLELALASAADDSAHPAFSKMFVETGVVAQHEGLIAHRRKRSPDAPDIWAGHLAVVEGTSLGDFAYETDRARFIGIGRDLGSPAAVQGSLSNTSGIVLDPIFSLRRRLLVRPGTTARVTFWTMVGGSREAVLEQMLKYDDPAAFDRLGTLAWTHAQVQLRHIDMSAAEATVCQRLASLILFPDPGFRATADILKRPDFDVHALWSVGVSGDLPIVLLRIDSTEDIVVMRELVLAHEYLRLKRLSFDLVVLNERGSSYAQDLQHAIEALARMSATRLHLPNEGRAGRIHVLRTDLITEESRAAIRQAARVVLAGSRGPLSVQLDRQATRPVDVPVPPRLARPTPERAGKSPPRAFDNGVGGFVDDGRAYEVTIEGDRRPPMPWINVVANPNFGFQVSADGASYTWALNSRDNQITPWTNDPVINRAGEALYIRDDDSGAVWGPTAYPYRHPEGVYTARHGRGVSTFEHAAAEIDARLVTFVPVEDAIKVMRLSLTNRSERPRRLSVAGYAEWIMASARGQSFGAITTEMTAAGALAARNPRNQAYRGRVAFLALREGEASFTGSRTEFLGRNGSVAEPAALAAATPLSGRVGPGLDACGALLTSIALAPGETRDVVILLGDAPSLEAADALVEKYRRADLDEVLSAVTGQWDRTLGALSVRTPDPSMDLMLNGWLLYQALACRQWARSGFYQASGAYGFRDQLQDSLAFLATMPSLAREQIVRAAGRQFVEGDLQHWWLPASGQGVRTRISDDPVWLAYAVCEYLRVTEDTALLDERIPYLEGPRLADHEHDAFFEPRQSEESDPLYDHVVRALERSLPTGANGLPLMGTGDWNDGMNLVGAAGKGESVWLAFFLYGALLRFADVGTARGDIANAARWRAHAGKLRAAIEANAWDGAWYRRAFFDDGTPLGSAVNDACRIDSIAQSWAVISGAAAPERARSALAEAGRQLVRPQDHLAALFTPPFDRTVLEPGYIKGYPPGLRENGGQYTHGAIWLVIAHALQGDGDRAAALFSLINPVNQAASPEDVARYKVEPYVVAADVYAAPGHVGRGGWTWYTGSAGWLYRAGIEWILGIRKEGDALRIAPCIPPSWPGFAATYRHGASEFQITVENPDGVSKGVRRLALDGSLLPGDRVPLVDDGGTHRVAVTLG